MNIRVLGCSGAELPGHNPPAFLVDQRILLDAGTIGAVLDQQEQEELDLIVVTHAHLDHIRGIPSLADNLAVAGSRRKVVVAGLREVIDALRKHLLNNAIWPDFSAIPTVEEAVLGFLELEPERELRWGAYSLTLCPVNHCVPAAGILLRHGGSSLVYTGDTGPTGRIWQMMETIDALIIEVSFANHLESLALAAGHLTPRLLARELEKIGELPGRILITHPKPRLLPQIERELAELSIPGLSILTDGCMFEV
ncbi:MAG TPA: 3',5'-cyclic-nucleotide phosphodiesterase [Geobacteraceae bacterium]|nr:3',5'-cyclic-nucleotide phosphodiesterase [Geobacteraceae bacterium]